MGTMKLKNADADIADLIRRIPDAKVGRSVAELIAGKLSEQAKPKRAPSHTPGVMNRTEEGYAKRLVELKCIEEVRRFIFEPPALVLGPNTDCEYTPDFLVEREDESKEYHEVKNVYVRDDSIVKLKWAAEKFTEFKFFLAKGRWDKSRGIYRWKIVRIGGTPETHRKAWK